ncbi:nucleotidyltransferase domain-containing protein [Candidatus Woesearchaeota archaeon]|nr:nucleotidyltransferase domain-containing protein [Candidatus Woesearchaeota archaeon]
MGENKVKIDSRISAFLKKVRKDYSIEKAIFFGSRARGDFMKNSDFDIILVSPDFNGTFFSARIAALYTYWDFWPLEIEPLCYTPEEFKKKSKEIGIVRTAVKEGVVI